MMQRYGALFVVQVPGGKKVPNEAKGAVFQGKRFCRAGQPDELREGGIEMSVVYFPLVVSGGVEPG